MKKKVTFIKCPRCDLNYIDKKQKMCTVCKAELNLVSPSILIPDEDVEEEFLCPKCHENFITAEEEMCYECYAKVTEENTLSEDDDLPEEEWGFVSDVIDEPLPIEEIGIDLSEEFKEEFEDKEEDEEEFYEDTLDEDEDDFEVLPIDDDFEDYDEDEDDDDEDDF